MSKDKLAQVFHFDLYGLREEKYKFLDDNSMATTPWKELKPQEPNYFLVDKDYDSLNHYQNGFKIDELFVIGSMGVTTARDNFTVSFSRTELRHRIEEFLKMEDETKIREHFNLGPDARDWKVSYAKNDLMENYVDKMTSLLKISYRTFDDRWTFYSGMSKGFHCFPRAEVMDSMLYNNLAFNTSKIGRDETKHNYFISQHITDKGICSSLDNNYSFPLYTYSRDAKPQLLDKNKRYPNLNERVVNKIAANLNLAFVEDDDLVVDFVAEGVDGTLYPLNILDYIYAVLHSPSYREKYKEFLKIDFPRVPYPTDKEKFWQLVALGKQIRELHLLESPKVDDYITSFPVAGENVITRKITKNDPGFIPEPNNPSIGKVWINDEQYFDKVPLIAWEFYIGGYQPAQKWLKDRQGRTLDFEDILHYQKIIVALTETDRLMKEVDEVIGKVYNKEI